MSIVKTFESKHSIQLLKTKYFNGENYMKLLSIDEVKTLIEISYIPLLNLLHERVKRFVDL
jgi:hypothetical protein